MQISQKPLKKSRHYDIIIKGGGANMKRLIFHVDVNSAFLSWESAYRVKNGKSDLRNIPSCVGGDPYSRKGIVLAKSISAKKYNILTGEPISAALEKCPNLVVVPPNFTLYSEYSKAFKDICRKYAPVVEEFSIDECFLDFTGTDYIYPDPIKLAYEIKDKIYNELGFTVNIGIGRNKLCAKMASDFEKPNKVHTLFPEEIPQKLWNLPVDNLLFVGESAASKLKNSYITTIGELAQSNPKNLRYILGDKLSIQAYNYANGLDNSPVLENPEQAKGYSISITLEENITCFDQANLILLNLADSVCSRLRKDYVKASQISVNIRYLDFKNKSRQRKLAKPVNSTNEIYRISKDILSEFWKGNHPLRLIGISLTEISSIQIGEQLSFFKNSNIQQEVKDEKIDKIVDNLREKFGYDAITRGTSVSHNVEVVKQSNEEDDS